MELTFSRVKRAFRPVRPFGRWYSGTIPIRIRGRWHRQVARKKECACPNRWWNEVAREPGRQTVRPFSPKLPWPDPAGGALGPPWSPGGGLPESGAENRWSAGLTRRLTRRPVVDIDCPIRPSRAVAGGSARRAECSAVSRRRRGFGRRFGGRPPCGIDANFGRMDHAWSIMRPSWGLPRCFPRNRPSSGPDVCASSTA